MTKILSPWSIIRNEIADYLVSLFDVSIDMILESLSPPTNQKMGDLTSTICFKLAKEKKKSPINIAKSVQAEIQKTPNISKVEITPSGFINFYIKKEFLSKLTLEAILKKKETYGDVENPSSKSVMVEFPSVNPSKPWHIGHARNAVLGDTLVRLLRVQGFNVISIDYINDLGLQIAQLLWKLSESNNEETDVKYDHYLGKKYVEVAKEIEENPDKMGKVYELLKKMETGDNIVWKKAREITQKCLLAQRETAHRMGIFHNAQIWESDLTRSRLFEETIEKILELNGIEKLESGEKKGCIVAKLESFSDLAKQKDTNKVLVRSNGTGTYTGKDTVFQLWKFGLTRDPFKYEIAQKYPEGKVLWSSTLEGESKPWGEIGSVFNVIMVHQAQPQRVIYAIMELMGYDEESKNSHHLSYNAVDLPGQKLSGRKGTWIGYSTDDILEEAVERAKKEVIQRNPDLAEKEVLQTAESVGIGAVRFALLKQSSEKKITFIWDQVLDFDGMASPYIQYSAVRAKRILEKLPKNIEHCNPELLIENTEHELLKLLAQFPDFLQNILNEMKKETWGTRIPLHNITYFIYDIAVAFSRFYNKCRVVEAETNELKQTRRALVESTLTVIKKGLDIMGIPVPKQM
ncbi:MAG: arginine--tRNA ligase [Candidatus Ranarchaeia archaeon]